MDLHFHPIGHIRSCFKEKFGTPRQPGLAPSALATVILDPPYDTEAAIRGLTGFSHVWILYAFHAAGDAAGRTTVRPPRLGGNRRVGVFATRSYFRPNPVGMSAVRLNGIDREDGHLRLHISGVDLIDGTPVVDIKPYLPWADSVAEARADYAHQPPMVHFEVFFSPEAEAACMRLSHPQRPYLRSLIEQVLAIDPRPAYRTDRPDARTYGMRLYDLNIRWSVRGDRLVVLSVEPADGAMDLPESA